MFFVPFQEVVAGIVDRPIRGPNHIRRPAESTEPVEKHLRLVQEDINRFTQAFHAYRTRNGAQPGASVLSSEKRVETFLAFLASGGYYRQVAYTYGVATCTAFVYLRDVADYMMRIAPQHISLPLPNELADLSLPLRDVNGRVRNVILYVDGVIIKIQRPDHAGDAYYCGRPGKSCDSLNVQYVVDRRGEVRHVISGLPGATHDKTAVEWSQDFMDFLDTLPDDMVVLLDPAYRVLHPRVLTTFVGRNLPREQLIFNNECTRLRQIVERTIGATELKWRMDQMKENRYPAKGSPLFASKCTVCVLHNQFTNFL